MTTDDIIKTVSKNLPLTKELHEQWVWVITKALNILCENDETVENPEASKYHNKAYSDIYLPKGCAKMGFVEGTIIDFKMKLTPNIYSIATKMIDDMKSNVSVNCCVIISYSRISPFSQNILLNAKLANKDVNIVSLPELLDNYDKFRQSVQEVIGQKNSKYDWEKERDKRIEQARWSFNIHKVSLFLGAGVSMSMNMPSWTSLLKQLLDKNHSNPDMAHIKSGDYESIDEACGHSSIITGRYTTMGLQNKDKDIQEILYKNVSASPSKLVSAICNATSKTNVESIITYNYDDLVEEELKSRKRSHSSIHGGMRCYAPDIPVYHVHGILPHKVPFYSKVVLSEQEYHDIYREAYHWSNVEQLHALCRNVCFFIGLSMTDPNLRRLCDIAMSMSSVSLVSSNTDCILSNEPEATHYAFLPRESFKKGCDNCPDCSKNTEHFDIMERMMQDLGVIVIWYKNHDELPDIINKIMK